MGSATLGACAGNGDLRGERTGNGAVCRGRVIACCTRDLVLGCRRAMSRGLLAHLHTHISMYMCVQICVYICVFADVIRMYAQEL